MVRQDIKFRWISLDTEVSLGKQQMHVHISGMANPEHTQAAMADTKERMRLKS
jgi:hypothetical protein